MAMACLRLFTLRLPPDLSWPCLYSCITLLIFFFAFGPYLRWLLLLDEDDFFEDDERELLRCDDLLPPLWLLLRCPPLCDELDLRWLELDFLAVAISCLAS
jgi:hypothetical protein